MFDTNLVMYSHQTDFWKIGDYSLTTEYATSRIRHSKHSRGTPSYRAPELVDSSDGKIYFTNRADIWAIGCFFQEIIIREKAFPGEFDVHRYCKSYGQSFLIPYDKL